jgi:CarD family transcriptional regulator
MQATALGFKVNDKIVHTTWGGGYIRSVTTKEVANEAIVCYEIELLLNTSRVFVPKDNLDVADVRHPGSKTENKKAIDILRSQKGNLSSDWKSRVTYLKNRLEDSTLGCYAETVRDLHAGYADDSISSTERKIYCRAYDLLASEVALIRDCDIRQAQRFIDTQLK